MIRFLIPEPKNRRSGGTLYDLQMFETLRGKECKVKIDWVLEGIGIKNLMGHLNKKDLLIVDGLVFHQNHQDANLLEDYNKIYLTHLPFWLEPGIDSKERVSRKSNEIEFIKNCNLVICTSEFISNELINNGISKEILLVIEPKLNPPVSRKNTFNKTPVALLAVGNVHYGKGIDILIEAMAQLDNKNWYLKIAGDFNPNDAYYMGLKKAIEQYGLSTKIKFLGECNGEKIEELYLNSDMLIHPSRFESYGMVVGEAIGYGLPAIASDAGALPAVYGATPVRFFNSENVYSLVDILQSVLKPEGYFEWVQSVQDYNFKSEDKEEYDDKINKLITHLPWM
jgi:glycosyltransferase involved in cell wall biosynthesis